MAQYTINEEVYQKNSEITLSSTESINYQNKQQLHKRAQQENGIPRTFGLKRFKSPQVLPTEDLFQNGPHPNCFLITPYLKLFHWSLLVPDVIEYDHDSGRFYCKKAKPLVKVLSYIWLLLILIYMSLLCFNDLNERYTVKAILGKVTWICYTLFDVTVIKCLRMNGDKIAKLLTEGNRISYLCDRIASLNSERPIQKKKINYPKYISLLGCIFSVAYTIPFVLYVITELIAQTTNLYNIFMNFTALSDHAINDENEYWKTNGENVRYNLMERFTSSPSAFLLLSLWLLMAYGVEIIWVIFLLMTASSGYYFNRLLSSCTNLIETNQIETSDGIRIFTQITLLLEDFNQLFGMTLLWIVTASVMYIAASLGDFLAGFTNEFIYDLLNTVCFLLFIATLYTGSELHRTGQILPTLLKRQFLHLDVTEQNEMFQILQGTSVVQYDALSNSVGLKGHGYFTISYLFVTSLVGVITTYSLIAVQFKLGEITVGSN